MMLQKFSEMKDHVSNAFSEIGSCSNANKSQKRKAGDDVEQSILSPLKERCSAPRKSPRLKLKHAEMEGNNEQPEGESHGMQKVCTTTSLSECLMEADGGDMPVQFGTSAAIAIPKRASHQAVTRRSQYIADLLDISLLGQMTLIPYNTG
ncbi:unnamed protein product, partial [Cuscuta europaea]